MADPVTVLATLKSVTSELSTLAPWVRKHLPQNSPIARAVRTTDEKYRTRLPHVGQALEKWILSDDFSGQIESIKSGQLPDEELRHVELFISVSGLGLGLSTFETVCESLAFFYNELFLELCSGAKGLRLIAAKLDMMHRDQREPRAGQLGSPSYRPAIETDATSNAITAEDREAETELNLIKTLIDKRQGKTALSLLAGLQERVDKGLLSAPIRFRYFNSKGICRLLNGDLDSAREEFERAKTLEPSNTKVFYNLGQLAVMQKDYTAALAYLERIFVVDAKDGNANALRFICLHNLDRDEEVKDILNENPGLLDHPHCLYSLAHIAQESGKFDEAEHYARRLTERNSTDPEGWELLGRTILIPIQRRLLETAASANWIPVPFRAPIEEAEACFSRAEELLATSETKDVKFTLANRGVVRGMLGRFDDARKDYERALQIDPSLEDVKRNLAMLYLVTGQSEHAVQLFEQIGSPDLKSKIAPSLAAAYLDQKNPTAARNVLEPLIERALKGRDFFLIDLYLNACQRLGDEPTCNRILSELAQITQQPEARRIIAEYMARQGKIAEAIHKMRLAVQEAGTLREPRYRLLLGDLQYHAQRYSEAVEQYELVPIPPNETVEAKRYLAALFATGRLGKALHIAQTIRGDRPAIADFSEIEALIYERSGALEEALKLRRAMLAAGISVERQKLKIAMNAFRRGRTNEASSLTLEVVLSHISKDAELLHDAAVLRAALFLPDALLFAYRLLREEPNDPESYLVYVNVFFRREEIDKALLQPTTIGVDCTVTLRQFDQTTITYTLVAEEDIDVENLSCEHPLGKLLLGKRLGDRIRFPPGDMSETEYEIIGIKSKFVSAFQTSLSRFNERFPSHYGISRLQLTPDDPTKIVLMVEQRRRVAERVLALYGTGQIPACTAARLLGQSDAECFRALLWDSNTKVLSFPGGKEQLQHDEEALQSCKGIIIESSALVVWHSLNLLPKLRAAFETIFVTQHTVDALARTAMDFFPEKQQGHLVSDRAGYVEVLSRTSDQVSREKEFYSQLTEFVQNECEIIGPVASSALEEFESVTSQKMLGSASLSTIVTAHESALLMISDDLPLKGVARNSFNVSSACTLSVIAYLRRRSILSGQEHHNAIKWFVERNVVFISVSADDLLTVLRENEWSPTSGVTQFFQTVLGPECTLNNALAVGLEALYGLWNQPLMTQTKQLLSDLVLHSLSGGRDSGEVLRALDRMNNQRSPLWTPAMANIQQVIRSWRPRRANSS